jgi:hypothetical protein
MTDAPRVADEPARQARGQRHRERRGRDGRWELRGQGLLGRRVALAARRDHHGRHRARRGDGRHGEREHRTGHVDALGLMDLALGLRPAEDRAERETEQDDAARDLERARPQADRLRHEVPATWKSGSTRRGDRDRA